MSNKPWKEAGYFYQIEETKHKELKSERNHSNYVESTKKNITIVSLDGLKEKEFAGFDVIRDEKVNVEEEVVRKMMIEKMWEGIRRLSADEYYILNELEIKEKNERKTETEVAEILGVSQAAISKRKKQIMAKVKKFIENEN